MIEYTGNGHYAHAYLAEIEPDLNADLLSPYLIADDSTCMEFYYQINAGYLQILRTTTTSPDPQTLWLASRVGTEAKGWEYARVTMPEGFYRVTIMAWTTQEQMAIDVAIDDVSIRKCEPGASI